MRTDQSAISLAGRVTDSRQCCGVAESKGSQGRRGKKDNSLKVLESLKKEMMTMMASQVRQPSALPTVSQAS